MRYRWGVSPVPTPGGPAEEDPEVAGRWAEAPSDSTPHIAETRKTPPRVGGHGTGSFGRGPSAGQPTDDCFVTAGINDPSAASDRRHSGAPSTPRRHSSARDLPPCREQSAERKENQPQREQGR